MSRRHYVDGSSPEVMSTYCRDPYGLPFCEHCDGEHSPLVRRDNLRGWVCKSCDGSLDAMYGRPRHEAPL
jgi:hypothetical protein